MSVIGVLRAEALKQRRRLGGSRLVVFSMLVWPVLELASAFYTVRPVMTAAAAERWPAAADEHQLFAFLVTGTLGFTFFFAQVQSAWHFSFERQTGTLELLFLSPANRLLLVIANGAGALVQNTWVFTCFTAAALSAFDVVRVRHPAMFAVVFLALLLPAVAWGTLLNSLLIFSRDSALLFTLFGEPVAFGSGVRLPTAVLPVWVGAAASLLPLTGSLIVVRGALLDGDGVAELGSHLLGLGVLSALLILLAALVLRVGERRAQRTGQLRLF